MAAKKAGGIMDFEPSAHSEQWRKKLQSFFDSDVLPRHRAWLEHTSRREAVPFLGELQQKARAAGLWNLGLPELADDEPGTRLSNLEYAPLAEIMGRLFWASEVFNCQAPDVPNMIALQNCATPEQKQRWLRPLLEAKTRSAFGMTEPDVASSDATNIATTLRRDGNHYIINGRKWFITGAAHPRCSFLIVMGVTDAAADRTSRHSCVIVPMDAPGVRLVRPLRWMGCEDHTAPIGELTFENVRIPSENLLGREGEGFKVAQVRLGPARIHHCMRSIGLCELLIELMMVRAAERSAFGRMVIQYDTVQRWIAEARVELEQARLLAYRCAWRLDQSGHHGASSSTKNWRDVSLVKVAVPSMLQKIADRAMQVFGAMGGSDDTPIHQALAWGRLLRIGDGPDEVHLRQIFRMEAAPPWSIADSPYLAAHPA
jgi:acyl-CoA dehydrogenase